MLPPSENSMSFHDRVVTLIFNPPDRRKRLVGISGTGEAIREKKTAKEKYLERFENMENVSYLRFLDRWNFRPTSHGNWREWP